jgi:Co/Zn/Cd efflux system component
MARSAVVRSGPMMAFAAGGLAVNLICAWILHGRHEIDLNIARRVDARHGDALWFRSGDSGGVCMSLFGWYAADALFSVVISVLIIWGSIRLIR